jgi:hypothetical protein
MWMTRPPRSSIRAAAAITSITMNGGTSLRVEAEISRFAFSSMLYRPSRASADAPQLPQLTHF